MKEVHKNAQKVGKKEALTKVVPVNSSREEKKSRKGWILGGVAVIAIAAIAFSQWCCPGKKDEAASKVTEEEGVVVAIINGEKLKLADLVAVKDSISQLKEIPMETVYNNLLEGYINSRVVLKAAEKAGTQNRSDVKKAIKEAEEQILSKAYLSEQLQSRMTKEKAEAIYEEELKNYIPQDEIHARHILVATEKEAKDLIVKLKNGANFEELANKYSLDKNPDMENGGDLGYFRKEMMIPEFGNAAFELKVGKFSETPVKTPFGWHVIKVEDKRKAAPPTMAEMQEYITAKFAEMTVPEILAEERAKMQVKVFDPLGVNKKQELVENKTEKEPNIQ